MRPFIRDDKIRKAVRAWYEIWSSLIGKKEISVISCGVSMELCLGSTVATIRVPLDEVICFPQTALGRKDAVYSIEELCGEEEEWL